MAVLKTQSSTVSAAASILDQIKLDPKSPANINYVKARIAIEEAGFPRGVCRGAKMVVIQHLQGVVRHPNPADRARGATNQVVFPDQSSARF